MPCFSPLSAWQTEGGEIVFAERGKIRRELTLPCGQCIGCRLERSRQWAMRCVHESQLYDFNVFITLTYDDDHLPYDGSLIYKHYQDFMKRLRKRKPGVRFYMCGEYGETTFRPHYHACLFNCFFNDRQVFSDSGSGCAMYTSAELASLWPFGFSSLGDVTFESAAYVARYVTKKVLGKGADLHYQRICGITGEVFQVEPEFTRMSLKPGIGAGWYRRYRKDVFPRNEVVIRGVKMKPPKYYDNLLKKEDNCDSDLMEYDRFVKSMQRIGDNTEDRLVVREQVCRARLSFKKRDLK